MIADIPLWVTGAFTFAWCYRSIIRGYKKGQPNWGLASIGWQLALIGGLLFYFSRKVQENIQTITPSANHRVALEQLGFAQFRYLSLAFFAAGGVVILAAVVRGGYQRYQFKRAADNPSASL